MQSNDSLASFLTVISSGGDGLPVSIEDAQQMTSLSRAAVLKRFRQLQEGGEGYLRLGRHGHPTRFYFRSKTSAKTDPLKKTVIQFSSVGKMPAAPVTAPVPAETSSRPAPPAGDAPAPGKDLVSHSYQLRQGLCVTLQLPADLTEREANRLARFIETLPL